MIRTITSAMLLLSAGALGQSTTERAVFETASVEPNRSSGPTGGVRAQADGVIGKNVTLKQLIAYAYGLRGYQISGPDWIATEGYDVTAQTKNSPGVAQFRSMLRALLEDRFRLKTHREMRDIPAYWLVVAKGGPKLRDVKEEESFKLAHAGNSPFRPGFMAIFSNKSLPEFAQRLGLDRPVIDKTEIQGRFWFQLEWADEPGQSGRGPLTLRAGPSLLTALEEQLGLRLEEQRASAEILVIDHAERASVN